MSGLLERRDENNEEFIKLYATKFRVFVLTHPEYMENDTPMHIVVDDFKEYLIKKNL